MASVFKRTYKRPDGRMVECKTCTAAFADWSDPTRGVGIVRQVPGYLSRDASEELGRNLEKLARLRAAHEPMPDDLRRYMEGLPAKLRGKLARWGLLNQTAEAAVKPLSGHLESYATALRDGVASHKQKGRPATPEHVQKTVNRVKTLLDRMSARTFSDITPAAVGRCLRDLEARGVRSKGIGSKSLKHYHGALYAFLSWAVRERLLPENPLRDSAKPDPAMDPRHRRRAFEPDEVARLLQAARKGEDHFGMTGEHRYWLYRLAVESGCRAGELRALTVANLTLTGPRPGVTVPAPVAKSRRERIIPLKPETASELRTFLRGKLPNAPVFRLLRPENIVVMLRHDLERAGVAYVDDSGRYADFHSLRGTFASNLIAAGVDVRTAQDLLGHASPMMTLGVYAKAFRGSHQSAIAKLPTYDRPEIESARATGTYDGRADCTGNCTDSGSKAAPNGQRDSSPIRFPGGSGEHVSNGGDAAYSGTDGAGVERGAKVKSLPPRGLEPLSSG
jgi:integrase